MQHKAVCVSAEYCYIKLMWTKRKDAGSSALWSLLTPCWFGSTVPTQTFTSSLSLFLPFLSSLFTHLLEEGQNEINISCSREKALCLLISLFCHLHSSFKISIIHSAARPVSDWLLSTVLGRARGGIMHACCRAFLSFHLLAPYLIAHGL